MKYLRNLSPHGTIYRDILLPNITSMLLSENTLNFRRQLYIFKRGNTLPKLNIFIAADDVQSFILLQCTQILMERYNVNVKLYLLPLGVNGWSSSLKEKYRWVNRDAGLFASLYSLEEPCLKSIDSVELNQSLYSQVSSDLQTIIQQVKDVDISTIQNCLERLRLIWGKEPSTSISSSKIDNFPPLSDNHKLLKKLGYYNPGAIEFEGEWYPPGRLHHLERRLNSEGNHSQSELFFDKEMEGAGHINQEPAQSPHEIPTIEVFYSFRSPYSQLVVPRLKNICAKYSCSIAIRPLLPMVTRGLPVPPEKEVYIALDAAREARLWNIPFGKIIDPLHPNRLPFLRALAAFEVASASENVHDINFVESYGFHQWGNGISAGTDSGLRIMMQDAKMNEQQIQKVFHTINSSTPEERFTYWEKMTSKNRSYLLSQGLWGVPCIKYKNITLFGQDKLWAIEKMISIDRMKEKELRVEQSDESLYQAISKYAGEASID